MLDEPKAKNGEQTLTGVNVHSHSRGQWDRSCNEGANNCGNYRLRLWSFEEFDKRAGVRIAEQSNTIAALHLDDSVRNNSDPRALQSSNEGVEILGLETDVVHANIGDAVGLDRLLAVFIFDELKTHSRVHVGGLRKRSVDHAQYVAVTSHRGVHEIATGPLRNCGGDLPPKQASVERLRLIRNQYHQADVIESRGISRPSRAPVHRRSRRTLLHDLDVHAVRIGDVGDGALRRARSCDQFVIPGPRPEQVGGFEL